MPQTNGWVCVGLYFFRFTFPDWLLLNLPPLSLFLNAMEGICDSGHIAIAVGRVTLLFQSWSWGTETLVRNLPKKSRFFPRFSRFTLVIKKNGSKRPMLLIPFSIFFPTSNLWGSIQLTGWYGKNGRRGGSLKIRPEWKVWNVTPAIRAWQFGYFIVAWSGL